MQTLTKGYEMSMVLFAARNQEEAFEEELYAAAIDFYMDLPDGSNVMTGYVIIDDARLEEAKKLLKKTRKEKE